MTADLFLALDQGGHASRAIVFNETGEILAKAECAITTQTPQADWVEHSAEELIHSVWQAIHDVCHQIGADIQKIKAAGLATQRSSIVCWDKNNGQALSPILSWQDRRQAEWIKQFAQHNQSIHQTTGLFLSPHYGASKLHWCLKNLPAVKTALAEERLVIGPLASFTANHLTQERGNYIDPANAGRTLLWNIETQQWDDTLCKLFSIPQQLLPTCTPTRHEFGCINIENKAIPLRILIGDQPAALYAWGKPNKNSCYVNIGTGAFIQRQTDTRITSDTLLTSIAYQGEQTLYTLEGTVNGAARALHTLNIPNLEQTLDHWLTEPTTPPLFLNGVSGVGSPYWLPQMESEFIPGEQSLGDKEKAIAVVESITFLIHRNIEELEKSLPIADNIIVSGGLSSLDGLCQRLADLTRRPVLRSNEPEATAQGLAFLIAEHPKSWRAFTPDKAFSPQTNNPLNKRYQQWLAEMEKKAEKSHSNSP